MRVNGAMAPGNVVAEAAVSGEHLTASLLGRPVGRLGLACCHGPPDSADTACSGGRLPRAEGGVPTTVAGDSSRVTRPGLITLWAAPRSRSTAFFRYMLEHGGLL